MIFLKKLANSEDFKSLIALSPEQLEELYNKELILRFISLYDNHSKINSSIAQHMTNFMRDALDNTSFDYEKLENIFNEVVTVLKPIGKGIFRQHNGMFATALYDTIMIGVAENISLYKDSSSVNRIKDKVREVRSDKVLIKFSRRGGNNHKVRITNRLKEANRIFGKS